MSARLLAAALMTVTTLTSLPANAVEATLQLQLGGELDDFQKHDVLYNCSDGEPFDVTYINSAPNFLALVPIADETQLRVFASVVSASDTRYASGQWIWETTGTDASLIDTTLAADAPAVLTCSEMVDTP